MYKTCERDETDKNLTPESMANINFKKVPKISIFVHLTYSLSDLKLNKNE